MMWKRWMGMRMRMMHPRGMSTGESQRLSCQKASPWLQLETQPTGKATLLAPMCAELLRCYFAPRWNSMMRTTTWMRSKLTKRQSDPSMDASRQLLSRRPKCQPGRPGRPGPGSNRRAQTENSLRTINIVIYRHAAGPVKSCQVSARGVT